MKTKAFLLSSLPFFFMPLLYADYPAVVLEDEPLAYYRFEESAGSTVIADSSGNGLDIDFGVPIGSTQLGEDGVIGLAAMFNGDGGILTPVTLDPSIGDFTLEAIIKPTAFVAAGSVILANQDGGGVGRSNFVVSGDGSINTFLGSGTTLSGVTSSPNAVYHVIMTYDQSAAGVVGEPTIRFYIDGVAGATGTRVAESASGAWVIGSHKSTASQFFNGLIDEVAIYTKRLDDPNGDGDLSDSRVAAHFREYLSDSDTLVSLTSDTPLVDPGMPATLSWVVAPSVTSLTLFDGESLVDVLPNTIDGVGSLVVMPAMTTTYTLEGDGAAGMEELEITVEVAAQAPVVASFSANAQNVAIGSTIRLAWEVTDATSVTIDNGIGDVSMLGGTISTEVSATTTYTLTASNAVGSVTSQLSVTAFALADPSLISHWRVGEAVGEVAGESLISESGDTFVGTLVGTPSFDTTDPAPVPSGSTASIVFGGDNSYVDVLDFPGIGGSSARTVAFWFKGSATQTNNHGTIVSWGRDAPGTRFDIRVNNNSSGILRTEVNGSGSNGTAIIADDTWHHCAMVLDPELGTTTGNFVYYIDGVLDPLSVAGGTQVVSSLELNVRFGASRSFVGRSLTGKLDDIRIYDRALDADEILTLVENSIDFKITGVLVLSDGSVQIDWEAPPGDYSVEYSFDLDQWLELDDPSIPVGESSAVTFDFSAATAGARVYYRIKSL